MRWLGPVVAAVAIALSGCADSATEVRATNEPATTTTTQRPEGKTLHVVCTADATVVEPGRVAARMDGLHVEVEDRTGAALSVMVVNDRAPQPWRFAYTRGKSVLNIAPGETLVRCVDTDTPEHSEDPATSSESQRVEVVAGDEAWLPPVAPDCSGFIMSASPDYAAPPEGGSLGSASQPEGAVRGNALVGHWVRSSDTLRQAGYRAGDTRAVLVVRAERVVGRVDVRRDAGGWYVVAYEACSDPEATSDHGSPSRTGPA